MKPLKLILLFFALVAIQIATAEWLHVPPPVEARGLMMVGGGVPVAGASCTLATIQQQTDSTDGSYEWNKTATTTYMGSQLSYSGTTGTLCTLKISMAKAGSPTGTLNTKIYSDSGSSHPSTLISTCDTIDSATLTDSLVEKTLACSDATITNGTLYWIVQHKVSNGTAVDNIWTGVDWTCSTERIDYSSDGASWTNDATNICVSYKLYIKE